MMLAKGYFWFLVPSIILFVFTTAYPFFSGINIAFTNWDGISNTYDYVWFKNFVDMFHDANILKSIRISITYALVYTVLNNILSLFLAIVLQKKFRGSGFFKTIFFIPMALSAVLAAFVWGFIDRNILSSVLGHSLLGSRETVVIGIIMIALWCGIGSNIMVYMAGLSNIPADYYEAASIDGATPWKQFIKITLPLLGPSFTTCITLTLTSALWEFAIPMSATGGGPARSSEMISIFIYNNLFSYQKFNFML